MIVAVGGSRGLVTAVAVVVGRVPVGPQSFLVEDVGDGREAIAGLGGRHVVDV
jgi:hypothetical protein